MPRPRRKLGIREADEDDADALARFSCSTGPWFEDEVERHVRTDALQRSTAGGNDDYRLLLFEEDGRLCAVGAHQPEPIILSTGRLIVATRLVALALSLDCQGAVASGGKRYSDLALTSLMGDALKHRRQSTLTSLVALENVRSQRLCRRWGLTSETLAHPRYVRMTGSFAVPGHAAVGDGRS